MAGFFTFSSLYLSLSLWSFSMSESILISQPLHSLHKRDPSYLPPPYLSTSLIPPSHLKTPLLSLHKIRIRGKTQAPLSYKVEGQFQDIDDGPASIELEPILSEGQFDRIIAEAHQLEESVIFVWMAGWCRKCIYLKPKLEKLAVDYHPRIRFYSIDVNTVPQRLVNRAGVTRMPTIQLWWDGEKQAEVIGGHKAWLVVNDVRQMIENES